MPLPLILLLGSGAVAAAAKGAAWLAERKVKQVNEEVHAAEVSAARKNDEFRAQRQQWKNEFASRFDAAAAAYQRFRGEHRLTDTEVDAYSVEPWLRERIGDLTIKRPLLIQPHFDMPADMHQMQGYRMMQMGSRFTQNHPGLGQGMQTAGAMYAAGAYVAQQTNAISESEKYIAAAHLYVTALRKTIDGFGSRFVAEVNDDLRSVERLARLLAELQAQRQADVRSLAIVHRSLVGFLRGLIGRYES